MLDERIRSVLTRLEGEDADERARGVPAAERSRQVAPTTGRFLFALVASRPGARVLEIGGSRGYSTIWIAAGARLAGGAVVSLEADPAKWEAWHRNVEDAGVEVDLVEDDAFAALPRPADIVFLDAEKDDYERLFALERPALGVGAVVVADNVLSHPDPLAQYSAARQADPTLQSVTVPLDRGLEVSVVLEPRSTEAGFARRSHYAAPGACDFFGKGDHGGNRPFPP